MRSSTLNDLYRCPYCKSVAARGDYHCRGCGVKYSKSDVDIMENNIRSTTGSLPWNTRDIYRCVHCAKYIAVLDNYCRGCGDEVEDHEKQLMRLKLSEIAKQNTPVLAGLALFVLVVILACVKMVN